jgi:hypothetical protein
MTIRSQSHINIVCTEERTGYQISGVLKMRKKAKKGIASPRDRDQHIQQSGNPTKNMGITVAAPRISMVSFPVSS